jgi:hypothetical protein
VGDELTDLFEDEEIEKDGAYSTEGHIALHRVKVVRCYKRCFDGVRIWRNLMEGVTAAFVVISEEHGNAIYLHMDEERTAEEFERQKRLASVRGTQER